jgi:hypothetical protein
MVSRVVVALLIVSVFSGPLYADVIPSRRAEASDASKKVQGRLVELGLSQDAATAHAQQLTEREASYFAENPDRVQIAGQEIWAGQTDLLWWEWVLGIAALAGAIWFGVYEVTR